MDFRKVLQIHIDNHKARAASYAADKGDHLLRRWVGKALKLGLPATSVHPRPALFYEVLHPETPQWN